MMSGSGGAATDKESERLRNARALHRMLSYAADEARVGEHDTCRRHILKALDALSRDLDLLTWNAGNSGCKTGSTTRQ